MGAHGNNKAITARGISEFIRWSEGLCNGTRERLELPRACMYGGLKYLILSSCERIAVENDSECALRKTVSAPNGEPGARGRQRPSKLAISLAHRLTDWRAHTHTHAGAISLSFSVFSCGAEEMASLLHSVSWQKNMHFTFCKNPRGHCSGPELCDSNCSIF